MIDHVAIKVSARTKIDDRWVSKEAEYPFPRFDSALSGLLQKFGPERVYKMFYDGWKIERQAELRTELENEHSGNGKVSHHKDENLAALGFPS